MNLKIISLKTFEKEAKRLYKKYKNLPLDLENLNKVLQENPKSGVELGNSCYKIRVANSSIPTGKSGGFRVVYYFIDSKNNLYLMSIYSKTELSNISEDKLLKILQYNGLV